MQGRATGGLPASGYSFIRVRKMIKSLIVLAASALLLQAPAAAQTAPASGGFVPSEGQLAELKAMFAKVDADGNGRLSRLELTGFGVSKGLGVAVRQKVWLQMDANRDGGVSVDEFIANSVSFENRRLARASR